MRKLYILFYIVQGFIWSAQPGYSKPLYNGVSFIGLDGYNSSTPPMLYNQKLCYVLDNQDNSPNNEGLLNTFAEYQKAGVNLMRVFITAGAEFGCNTDEYAEPLYNGAHPDGSPPPYAVAPNGPALRAHRIQTMNDLIVKAAGYGIKTELLFSTPARDGNDPSPTRGYYMDPYPYNNDEAWIATWMQGLNSNMKNIALIGLAPEIRVQSHDLTNGRHTFSPNIPGGDIWKGYADNNALYAKTIWTWFKVAFPSAPATVEFWTEGFNDTPIPGLPKDVTAPSGLTYQADPLLVYDLANWSGTNLPGQSYITIETYFYLPINTSSRNDYLSTAKSMLSGYFSSSFYQSKHVPLWIDEMGHAVCTPQRQECPALEENQENYYSGMLNASEQYQANQLGGRVAWVGSNDYPNREGHVFGLISGYNRYHQPMFRSAWKTLSSFYLGNPLSVPANGGAR